MPTAAPPPKYATAPVAMRAAIRVAVADAAPHARLGGVAVACATPVQAGEATTCDGHFAVHARAGAPRTYYVLTGRSRVVRRDAATLSATLRAIPYRPRLTARRGLPARMDGERDLTRPPAPAERTVHADVVLRHGRQDRLSRDRWLAFAVPSGFTQAYDEGPVTVHGAVDHDFELPPGGHCIVRIEAQAGVTATPPREQPAGHLLVDPADDNGGDGSDNPKILTRTTAPDGTVAYTILDPSPLEQPTAVLVTRAPAGLAPARLPWLVITARAGIHDLVRLGAPGPDGYRVLDPLPAQERACGAAAARVAAAAVPRIAATATIAVRPRPPRADPDDEGPIPVEPRSYAAGG